MDYRPFLNPPRTSARRPSAAFLALAAGTLLVAGLCIGFGNSGNQLSAAVSATRMIPKVGLNMPVFGSARSSSFMAAAPSMQQQQRAFTVSQRPSLQKVNCAGAPAVATDSAKAEEKKDYKVLMRMEMPEFIPRPDLMEQFLRWAYIEVEENCKENFGYAEIPVTPIYLEDKWVVEYGEDPATTKVCNGFLAKFDETELAVVMDDTIIYGYEYIGMDENGFPERRGDPFEILGQNLEVRKIDDKPVTDQTREAIKRFGGLLKSAFDKYYAFGSIYADDAT